MGRSLNIYTHLRLPQLDLLVKAHQAHFDEFLEDSFTDEELNQYETLIDGIAAVWVQPILPDLSFEDFYADEKTEVLQRDFFQSAQSSILLDNLPFFENNPFQISYLQMLLKRLGDVLIDRGGVSHLMFTQDYLPEISKFKTAEAFIDEGPKIPQITSIPGRPVHPIDFLVLDVYREVKRLKGSQHLNLTLMPEKTNKIYQVMQTPDLDASEILKLSGLIPKDFGDNLERLKFILKKI